MKVEAYICTVGRSVQLDITPLLDDLPIQEIELLRHEGSGTTLFYHENGEGDSYHLFSGRVAAAICSRLITDGALDTYLALKRNAITWGSNLYVDFQLLRDYYINRVSKDAVDSLLGSDLP